MVITSKCSFVELLTGGFHIQHGFLILVL